MLFGRKELEKVPERELGVAGRINQNNFSPTPRSGRRLDGELQRGCSVAAQAWDEVVVVPGAPRADTSLGPCPTRKEGSELGLPSWHRPWPGDSEASLELPGQSPCKAEGLTRKDQN